MQIDKVKKYWNRSPCNIRHSKLELCTKEYFDEVEQKRYLVEPHNFEFANFNKWNGKKVLEIGCGIGTDTINFARYGASVTAIDVSEESIKIAKKRAKVFGLSENITFHCASAENLDFLVNSQEKFDLIYSFGVIHHTPSPKNIVKYFKDLLTDSGEVRVMLYHKYSWKVFRILISHMGFKFWDLNGLVANHSEAIEGCPVTYLYSKKSGKELLESEGLRITHTYVRHIFRWRVKNYIKNQYNKSLFWKLIPDRVYDRIQRIFGWHLCIVGIKNVHHS